MITVAYSSLLHGAQQPFLTSIVHQAAMSNGHVDLARSQALDVAQRLLQIST